MFTSPAGRPAHPKAVRNEFDDLIATAGIEGHWTPNLLRNTAASLMTDAGLPILCGVLEPRTQIFRPDSVRRRPSARPVLHRSRLERPAIC